MMTNEDCEKLQKQVEYLQKQCRKAGNTIKQLEDKIKDNNEISQGHRKIIGDTYKEVDELRKQLKESKERECKCSTKTST
jgi:uncharacterized coiled-coil DUF342 family protein